MKDLFHICLEIKAQGFWMTFKVCNHGPKYPYLLHKMVFVDSQFGTTVLYNHISLRSFMYVLMFMCILHMSKNFFTFSLWSQLKTNCLHSSGKFFFWQQETVFHFLTRFRVRSLFSQKENSWHWEYTSIFPFSVKLKMSPAELCCMIEQVGPKKTNNLWVL